MNANAIITTDCQARIVEQAIRHGGWTYWRPISEHLRISPEAAFGSMKALMYKRVFQPFIAFPRTNGYRLTPFGCRLCNQPLSFSKRIGEQGMIFRLARIVDTERRHAKTYDPDGILKEFPQLRNFADLSTRFVSGESAEIVSLYVDHGGSPGRALSRVNSIAARYLEDPEAARLVWSGRLGVRLLTASAGKAEAISRAFKRASDEPLARVEIDVVEDLQHLLAGRLGA